MGRNELRFSLLQARNPGDPARLHEHEAFAARIGVPMGAITLVDVLQETLDTALLARTDVLLVGGSGEYSVLDEHAPIRRFVDFLAEAALDGPPMFASCFGFQALVLGLGGEVIHDEPNAEVGTYWMARSSDASTDPLFSSFPERFRAQLGHKDRASRLPDTVVGLASSERAPFQALRVRGRPVYATQFHPELTWQDNRSRFERYMPQYGKLFGREEAQRRLDSHVPSPEANTLLPRFVDEIVMGQGSTP